MMADMPPDFQRIIELLSTLKAETPEYPAHLLEARKIAFLKQAATLNIPGKGQGGEGGQQGGGGSGTALGGSTTAQGIILQSLIALGLVAAMLAGLLMGNYVIDDKEADAGPPNKNPVAARESPDPVILPVTSMSETPTGQNLILATPTAPVTITGTPTVTGTLPVEDETVDLVDIPGTPTGTNDNPGLHLGQTPGAPAAPGQGNPGNVNQPDKPEPDKPDKPEPGKPDKPDK